MNVVVVSEARFFKSEDGAVWADVGSYNFWTRYLDAFDTVTVVARQGTALPVHPRMERADGPGVSFAPIPYYVGVMQFLRQWRRVRTAVQQTIGPRDAVIVRLGSVLALQLERTLIRSGRPYAVEVVGDPWDVFAPGVVRHPLRPVVRRRLTNSQTRLCASAAAATYVTARALQSRYPCHAAQAFTAGCDAMLNPAVTHFSDVELAGEDFAHAARAWAGQRPLSIATVGSLAQPYKGVDVLIKAAASLVKAGTEVELTVVGDGRCRADLERLARSCGLRVRFLGNIPRPEVLRTLDDCDLFVLASRTEGLPRAMIEAMARGLPCIGTRVGGVPELLARDDLVNPGSVPELASKIRELAGNLDRLHAAAKRNLRVAQEYRDDRLRRRRSHFYSQIRRLTESWLKTVPVSEPRTGS